MGRVSLQSASTIKTSLTGMTVAAIVVLVRGTIVIYIPTLLYTCVQFFEYLETFAEEVCCPTALSWLFLPHFTA